MAAILVVDDDGSCARYASAALTESGHEVRCAANGVEALLLVEERLPDLVLSDLRMPEMDGLELLAHLRQGWPELPVLLITVDEDIEHVVQAVQSGAVNYLLKPCAPERLCDAVEKALRIPRSPRQHGYDEMARIIGRSRAMVEVRQAVLFASRAEMPVLITGRTGTGKEIVARTIHAASKRSSGPFVAHNCALAPRDLVDSVLFGHRRGAFTGADRDQVGLFEQADGGVLFLDELEAMSLELQAKLLRVLDDGEVHAIGSPKARHVSIRFVAATNREPLTMVAEGTLREDLYWRLRGLEIHLIPLSERLEDVQPLTEHFLGDDHAGISPEAAEALRECAWPGNVRELKNRILVAREKAQGQRIELRHLQLEPTHRGAPPGEPPRSSRTQTLKESENEVILRTLAACGGNRTRAARALGIDRATLRRKLAELERAGGKAPRMP